MSSSVQRRSGGARSQSQSVFFRDITSPVSYSHGNQHRSGGGSSGKFVTPSKAAAVSALWKENFNSSSSPSPSDLPPPPIFTLEDRTADFSPEALDVLPPPSPDYRHRNLMLTPAPTEKKDMNQTTASGTWWSPARNGSGEEGEKVGSPVDGVVQQSGALVMFPPPREVVRPEIRRENLMPTGGLDVEEWITVYGFSPGDTNLVLREFEKCGVVLKHIAGPRDANWMHILYQNRYNSQKALAKNGMQINNVLIIGVKPVDHLQRKFLNEKLNTSNQGGFNLPFRPHSSANVRSTDVGVPSSSKQSTTPVGISDVCRRSDGGAIAAPAKSVISKAMDLMFGF